MTTGHITFDKQLNGRSGYVGTGNVVSATQYSSYIRGHHQTSCNGVPFEPGVLQRKDIDKFKGLLEPRTLLKVMAHLNGQSSGILYVFFHTSSRRRIVHGWALTSANHQLVFSHTTGPTRKSTAVMRAMIDRVTKPQSAHEILADMADALA